MLVQFFEKNWVRNVTSLLLLLLTLWCVLRPDYYFLQSGVGYIQYILIGELLLGITFLLLRQPSLTFIAFGCCALLCLFLKFNSNTFIKVPKVTDQPIFNIAHFNLANSDSEPEVTFNTMLESQADLISVQEVTPLWDSMLHVNLVEQYPYFYRLVDIGLYGMAVYSKQPFLKLDTFHYQNIPNIIGQIASKLPEAKPVHFIISHTMPAFSSDTYAHLQKHLKLVAKKCARIKEPLVTLGQYNAITWSNVIQNFREQSQLSDSRELIRTQSNGGVLPFFDVPEDYIFYSADYFNCLTFETLSSENASHIGIKTTLQFRNIVSAHEQKHLPKAN
ncbi:MAG: endonuclease/exonuclease/phosphatase family protein [Saprospiraceae bacterium]